MAKQSPFARGNEGDMYYTLDGRGFIYMDFEDPRYNQDIGDVYAAGNYCTDHDLMKQRVLHETLNRLLWRFSMENGERENKWDGKHGHYYIYNTDPVFSSFEVGLRFHSKTNGVAYFPSMELAKQAIHDIIEPFMEEHHDFVW